MGLHQADTCKDGMRCADRQLTNDRYDRNTEMLLSPRILLGVRSTAVQRFQGTFAAIFKPARQLSVTVLPLPCLHSGGYRGCCLLVK